MSNPKITMVPVDSIIPYENNPRKNDDAVEYVANSIREFGFQSPIIVDSNNVIVCGHTRAKAAQKLGLTEVPVVVADGLTDEQVKAYRLADNKTNEFAEWDFSMLNEELEGIDWLEINMEHFGFQLDDEIFSGGGSDNNEEAKQKLTERFIVPPFTTLDTRQGYWMERKQYWKQLIGDAGEARNDAGVYDGNETIAKNFGIEFAYNGVSILDPVLSELICRWFLPDSGLCIDTFAGDTVFGYVSTYLGNRFIGTELRKDQADFNQARLDDAGLNGKYFCDDGRNILDHVQENSADLFFSCPPYFDLEQYSDMENDASNQESFEEFYEILNTAFSNGIKALKDNRFAVIVIGNVRNKKTAFYYPFIQCVLDTFERNGMGLYNHAILITPVGTACIRANKSMKTRKLVSCHQDVLIFYKGDTKNIKSVFPEIEVDVESEDE